MKTHFKNLNVRRSIVAVMLFLVLGAFLACGGGSSGTGGNQFEGTVFSPERVALSDVEVMLAETGTTTRTDTNGFYSFSARQPEGPLTFVFTREEGSVAVTISPLPQSAVISIDFEIDLLASSGNPIRVEVQEFDDDSSDDSDSFDDDLSDDDSSDDDLLDDSSDDDLLDDDSSDDDSFDDESDNDDSFDDDLDDNSSDD